MIGRKCIPGKIILGIKSYSEIDVTLSTHKTRKKGFAKSVLHFVFDFCLPNIPYFESGQFNFIDGIFHFGNSVVKD